MTFFLVKLLYQIQKILGIAGKTGNGFHDDNIAFSDKAEKRLEFRTVCILAAEFIEEDFFHAEALHQNFLPRLILFERTNADISNLHKQPFYSAGISVPLYFESLSDLLTMRTSFSKPCFFI